MFKNIKLFPPFNFFIWLTFYSAVAVVYFAKITGSYALAVSLFSVSQLAKAAWEVPSGVFSDKYGRRRCLIGGAWLSCLSTFFLAAAGNYWLLLVGMIFAGASQACFSGNNDALLYESLPKLNRQGKYTLYLGKTRSVTEGSFLAGALIGSLLVAHSYSLLMWLSLIPQLIGLSMSYGFIEPRRRLVTDQGGHLSLKAALRFFKSSQALRRLGLVQAIQLGIGEGSWPLVIVFYNSMLPAWLASLIVTSHFLISIVSYRLSGWIIKKLSALTLLIMQEVYARIIFLFALLLPTAASPILMALASILFGAGEVAKSLLLQERLTNNQRATMSSTVSLVGSGLYAICSVLLGFLADQWGIVNTLLTVQVLSLPILWLYLQLRKN